MRLVIRRSCEGTDDKTRARLIAEAFDALEDRFPQISDLATQGHVRARELRLQKEINEVEARLQREIREVEARVHKEIKVSRPACIERSKRKKGAAKKTSRTST